VPHVEISRLILDLLIVLGAGLVAGVVCKRLSVSFLIGYLVVGALIGRGGMQLVSDQRAEVELLAEAGALLLLFSVGIEFSLTELLKLSRFFLIGGAVQMLLVAIPLALAARWLGWEWPASILAGSAGALSSTVLVFRALHELGQSATPHGRRALGILLFQDVALVPLLMLLPLLTGSGERPTLGHFARLGATAIAFVLGTWVLQWAVRRSMVPLLANLRSVEIMVLFAVCVVGGVSWVASRLELPAAVGALAAGLVLSGNRLSGQIDSILLPFREVFAAVFFVTLGMLLRPLSFFDDPLRLSVAFCGVLAIKTFAAACALRCTGLRWRRAVGMGLGLSQLGEFSFLLVGQGLANGLIDAADYNRLLLIAIATLIATPQLIRFGLRQAAEVEAEATLDPQAAHLAEQQALIIGIGPIGRQVTSRLELMGIDAGLIDLSPINLQPFAQMGFRTYSGDARDPDVLERAGVAQCRLVVVCVPADDIALELVRSLRQVNRSTTIVVRCRFQAHVGELQSAGADGVISEELEASTPLVALCERMLRGRTEPTA
jgi:CPA2 family monovalent cation:H+ antiporter-2